MKKLIVILLAVVAYSATANVVGGDISLLTQYEQHGAKYYDKNGKRINDMLGFFKERGLTAMRVRLFVDPSKASAEDKGQGVCQDLEYVKALGARIKAAGFKLLLDFHYSDSWADPVKQYTPDAWKNLTEDQLPDTLYAYTRRCLQEMVAAGATPDYIQTGNEISYGMLWGPVRLSGGAVCTLLSAIFSSAMRFVTLSSSSATIAILD